MGQWWSVGPRSPISGSQDSGGTGSRVTGAGFSPRHSQDDVRAQGDSQPIRPQTGLQAWSFSWRRIRRELATVGEGPAQAGRGADPGGTGRGVRQDASCPRTPAVPGPGGEGAETGRVEQGPSSSGLWLVGSLRENPRVLPVGCTLSGDPGPQSRDRGGWVRRRGTQLSVHADHGI